MSGGSREAPVLCQQPYARSVQNAQFRPRILMNLSMDQKLRSVYKLLFIYTALNYNVFDTMCVMRGPHRKPAQRSHG